MLMIMVIMVMMPMVKMMRECLLQNGRFKYFLIATFHSWSPPSQAQALVGEEPSGEIPQVERRMGWTCPYLCHDDF